MAEIKPATATEFQGESGDQQFELFKRATVVHVANEVQEATSQWKLGVPAQEISNSSTAGSEISGKRKRKSDSSEDEAALKPYECRFCPMKFAKSQALGGHMNRHRQEREREQLLHARQLVLQQGIPWVAGQNQKLQRSSSSDCFNSRVSAMTPPPTLASSFQLSQSSLSWNISSHVMPPDKSTSADDMHRASSFCPDMPYMVPHGTGIRAAPFPGDDLLVMSPVAFDEKPAAAAADVAAVDAATVAASYDPQQALDHVKDHDDERQFPSLQLGPCSSEMISASPLNHLDMAVDFEQQHQQLLSLGGFSTGGGGGGGGGLTGFVAAAEDDGENGEGGGGGRVVGDGGEGGGAAAAAMAEMMAAQCDGLSWIFGSKAPSVAAEGGGGGGGAVAAQDPSCFMDGFGLALGRPDDDSGEEPEGVVTSSTKADEH